MMRRQAMDPKMHVLSEPLGAQPRYPLLVLNFGLACGVLVEKDTL